MTIAIRYTDLRWTDVARMSISRASDIGSVDRLEALASAQGGRAFGVSSGRVALGLALREFARRQPRRRRVVLPEYICPSVEQAVQREGLYIVKAPVGRDLNMDPGRLAGLFAEDVLAVLVAHMYGCPANVAAVERQAREAGVFVIDDAAHCLGFPERGAPCPGAGGHVGIHSFALSKAVSNGYSGRGGILRVNDPGLLGSLQQAIVALPVAASPALDDLRFVLTCLCEGAFARLPWPMQRSLGRLLESQAPNAWRAARIAPRDARLALVQIERLASSRQTRAARLRTVLDALPDGSDYWLPHRQLPADLTRLAVCMRRSVDPVALKRLAAEVGFRLRMGYPAPVGTVGTIFEVPFGSPWTTQALHRLREGLDRLAGS